MLIKLVFYLMLPLDVLFIIAEFCDEPTYHKLTQIEPELECMREVFCKNIKYIGYDEYHYIKTKYAYHFILGRYHERYEGWDCINDTYHLFEEIDNKKYNAILHDQSNFVIKSLENTKLYSLESNVCIHKDTLYYINQSIVKYTHNYVWWSEWSFYDGEYICIPAMKIVLDVSILKNKYPYFSFNDVKFHVYHRNLLGHCFVLHSELNTIYSYKNGILSKLSELPGPIILFHPGEVIIDSDIECNTPGLCVKNVHKYDVIKDGIAIFDKYKYDFFKEELTLLNESGRNDPL